MFRSEASSCAMAHWCSRCAQGPESKTSGRNQSPFGGSHLFCSTNESDFQAGGGGLKQGPHRCSYLRRAAASFWMLCVKSSFLHACEMSFMAPPLEPDWAPTCHFPLLNQFGFRCCLLCCITENKTVTLLQESFNIKIRRIHFFALIKYCALIWKVEVVEKLQVLMTPGVVSHELRLVSVVFT